MNDKIAMQKRCIHCKKEQYAMNVFDVSMGKSACSWCGKKSTKMSVDEYRKELSK